MAKSKKEKLEVVEQQEEQSTFYYFYSQGCGFCKRSEPIVDEINKEGKYEILKLDLAESDNQGLKKELEQKYKKNCGTPWFINADTGHQVCGFREKDIIEKWLAGEDIPEPPRPKSPMPRVPFMDAPKKEENQWKKDYKKWADENSHLPGLETTEEILKRFEKWKAEQEAQNKQNNANKEWLESRLSTLEKKLDTLMNHLGVKSE